MDYDFKIESQSKNEMNRNYTMNNFSDSWNFGVGLYGNTDIDPFDNEYVDFVGGFRTSEGVKLNGDYYLVKCNQKKNAPFISERNFKEWYGGSVCFNQERNITMRGSYWLDDYISPIILVT